MFSQLPLRLLPSAIVALLWGFVGRDALLAVPILVCSLFATASKEPEPFAPRLLRAMVVGLTFAVIDLYSLRAMGR